jgi:hypothetical protein
MAVKHRVLEFSLAVELWQCIAQDDSFDTKSAPALGIGVKTAPRPSGQVSSQFANAKKISLSDKQW